MRRKTVKFVILFFAFLVLTVLASVSEAKTIYVPDDYARIQWAVDNASAGDTIIVRDGTYYENLKVDKKLTIKSENGSDNCIIDGGGSGDVITLNADGITIEGFTVRNSGSYWPDAGIEVVSNANKIAYNSITNNYKGIYLYSSILRTTLFIAQPVPPFALIPATTLLRTTPSQTISMESSSTLPAITP